MHARTQSVWYSCNKYCFILYFCGATTSSIPGLQSHMSARFRSTHLAPFRSPQAPCSALLRAIILLRHITYHTLIHRKRVTHTAFPHAYLSTSLTRKVQLRRLTAVFRKKTLDPAIPQILCYRKMVAVHPYAVSPDQSRLVQCISFYPIPISQLQYQVQTIPKAKVSRQSAGFKTYLHLSLTKSIIKLEFEKTGNSKTAPSRTGSDMRSKSRHSLS